EKQSQSYKGFVDAIKAPAMLSGFSSFIKRHTAIVSVLGFAIALPTVYAIYLYLKKTRQQNDENREESSSDRRGEKLDELRGKLLALTNTLNTQERLLVSLEQIVPEVAESEDEE
ncbi:hypothetical protein QZH41_017370, partial [Actinostola sp. cb2023]